MPNWASNELTITHNKVSLEIKELFQQTCKEGDNIPLFQHFVPMPEELKNTIAPCPRVEALEEKYGASNWYDWRYKNWGCKWEVADIYLAEEEKNSVTLCFNTAWCPPITFYKNLIEKYPDIRLYANYTEESNEYAGYYEYTPQDLEDVSFDPNEVFKSLLESYKSSKPTPKSFSEFWFELEKLYEKYYYDYSLRVPFSNIFWESCEERFEEEGYKLGDFNIIREGNQQ